MKAFTLLIVFAMNMLLGFACSIGVNMGYNQNHHHFDVASDKYSGPTPGDCHNVVSRDANSGDTPDSSNDKDCCSHGVVKFFQLDKNTSTPNPDLLVPAQLIGNHRTYQMELLQYLQNSEPKTHHFVRSNHPPIHDIRTAIQSFLI